MPDDIREQLANIITYHTVMDADQVWRPPLHAYVKADRILAQFNVTPKN